MPGNAKPIPRVQVGGVSLVSADYANQLIDILNAVIAAEVAPIANVGTFVVSKDKIILDLSRLDGRVRGVENAAYGNANFGQLNTVYNTAGTLNSSTVISASNRYATIRQISNAWCLDFTPLHATLDAINTRLTNLIASINNANISANCNANTNTITVTLTFPNVPGV